MTEYQFSEIEKKWQQRWAAQKTYKTTIDKDKPKYYVLAMFPYPSGAGLHVGHPLGYIASDIVARYKKLKGFNVLHPMGYDAFGLPAEQYAIQTGQHPSITTKNNIERYRQQLDKIGLGYDWDREIKTCDPEYYHWTQWIFIQLFNSWYNNETNKAESIQTLIAHFKTKGFHESHHSILTGNIEHSIASFTAEEWESFPQEKQQDILLNFRLAYINEAFVNWCPALGTVLANDEVKDGVSERGGYPVERKLMKQWSLRITVYAERLLNDLDTIEWSDSIKEAQRNWIGKSVGSGVTFKVDNLPLQIDVFTTRPDTIFGVTFITLAPEHELIEQLTTAEYKTLVDEYVHYAKNRSERERQTEVRKITGQFTGAYAIHPFSRKKVPIWIGDYVLVGYGTGAVMGVPAHDNRDFAFAKHFGLEIIQVVHAAEAIANNQKNLEQSYDAKEGTLINSDFLNGLEVKAAIRKAIEAIEQKGIGEGKINYRLRDAVFGRQRYWGEPIPVYYKEGLPCVLPENELPLLLPEVNKYLPTEDGEPPLARAHNWKYKGQYDYEHTTMPGWAGSSWYFLRYMDPQNKNRFAGKDEVAYWQQVDLYLGGSEHATGHLLYVRFWTKFLYDLGLIPVNEPAKKLVNQGMIQGISEKVFSFFKLDYSIGALDEDSSTGCSTLSLYSSQIVEVDDYIEKLGGQEKEIKLTIPEPYDSFIKKDINRTFLSAELVKSTDNFQKINLDIKLIENNKVNFKKYFESENSSNQVNNLFLCEGGIWFKGKFHRLGEGSNEFKTSPEVEKMSKSKWNVVNPDEIINQYGADTLRLYEMFLGPLEQSKPWSTQGIEGTFRFLKKLWRLFYNQNGEWLVTDETPAPAELKVLHKTIKKVQEDIENLSFNTSVSAFMVCVNELSDLKCSNRSVLSDLVILLSPFAPHICEELWEQLGNKESITNANFPVHNPDYLAESSFSYPVSINGKVRVNIEMDLSLESKEVEALVLADTTVQKWLEGKQPKKVIHVKGRIVNVVV